MQPGKKRRARTLVTRRMFLLAGSVAVLAGVGAIAAERAVHGHGFMHRFALRLYRSYKQQKAAAAAAALAEKAPPERAEETLVVYRHGLTANWADWSWATHDLKRQTGDAGVVLSMTPESFKGIYLHCDGDIALGGYGMLRLHVRGDSPLKVCAVAPGGAFGPALVLRDYVVPAGAEKASDDPLPTGWKAVEIPLAKLEVAAGGAVGTRISGIVFQAAEAAASPEALFDNIVFLPDRSLPVPPENAIIAVSVDTQADRHPISPLIYGMAFAPQDYLTDLRLTINRWGGNDKSRYNWVHGNAVNAARDWNWANRVVVLKNLHGASSAADDFVRENQRGKAETLLTIPALGWVARNTDNGCTSQNVPGQGDAPIPGTEADGGSIAGYDAASNRTRTSVRSVARKGGPFELSPSVDSPVVYQDEWVNHLKQTFGAASTPGGVRFYAIDNEPDLWASTHTDVHPARAGYDEVLSRFLSYASAVKDVDPSAQVTGPVSWGWSGYFYSALDQGRDAYRTHADRKKHGDVPFIPWFLKQVAQHDKQRNRRTLDVLDVHFYPQANLYNQDIQHETQAIRLRSTRALWDADYTDESWIAEPVRLLPRLHEWINDNYPGTKIGITEWNFGADEHINGGLAIAEALGIYGRDNVYMANYWAYPAKDSPGYRAFKLLRRPDPDGADSFGDVSVRAESEKDYKLSCFAATDTKRSMVTLLLVNKMPRTTVRVPVTVSGEQTASAARTYLLFATEPSGKKAAIISGQAAATYNRPRGKTVFRVTLPPYSAMLICLPVQKTAAQDVRAKGKN